MTKKTVYKDSWSNCAYEVKTLRKKIKYNLNVLDIY